MITFQAIAQAKLDAGYEKNALTKAFINLKEANDKRDRKDHLLYLSHSEMSSFATCRQRWNFEYVQKIKPRAERVYFYIGRLLHIAVEYQLYCHYYNYAATCTEIKAVFLYFAVVALAEIETNTAGLPVDYGSYEHQIKLGNAIIDGYCKHWQYIPEVSSFGGFPQTEVFFAQLLETDKGSLSNKFCRVGKADALIKYVDKIFLLENKFISSFDAGDLKFLTMDSQVASYIWGLQKEYAIEISGCLYNVARKSALRQGKNETVDQYQERLIADYAIRPDFYFERHYIYFNQGFIRQVGRSLWETAKDMSDPYIYPCSTFICKRTGCSFSDICTAPADAREEIIGSLYMTKFAKHEELDM